MEPGFNENVIHNGVLYHVQTEDGGERNPVVTTILFKDGAIIATERSDYSGELQSGDRARRVKKIMREQHSDVTRNLQEGRYDLAQRKPAEDGEQAHPVERPENTPLASDGGKGLDEIILDYLSMGDKK